MEEGDTAATKLLDRTFRPGFEGEAGPFLPPSPMVCRDRLRPTRPCAPWVVGAPLPELVLE